VAGRSQGDLSHVLPSDRVVERSWGIPPPTLTVETTSVQGWKRSGSRVDKSVGGGGALDYARVRDALEKAVAGVITPPARRPPA
jgi:hypothetical protein